MCLHPCVQFALLTYAQLAMWCAIQCCSVCCISYLNCLTVSSTATILAAGSTHVPQSRAIFEVKKAAGQDGSATEQTSEDPAQEKEILSVTIFRELRGGSEIAVFLSPSPVRGMCLCL